MHLKRYRIVVSAVRILVLFVLAAMPLLAAPQDPEILGLRVYANDDEYQPPIVTKPGIVTIEFDVTTPQPPDLRWSLCMRHGIGLRNPHTADGRVPFRFTES